MRDTSIHRIVMSAAGASVGTTVAVHEPLASPLGTPAMVIAGMGGIYLVKEIRILIHRVRVNRRARSYKDDTLRYAGRFTAAPGNDKAVKRNSRPLLAFLKNADSQVEVDRWAETMRLQDLADFENRAGTHNDPKRFLDDATDRYWDVDDATVGGGF
jgi:hypothetical protein